ALGRLSSSKGKVGGSARSRRRWARPCRELRFVTLVRRTTRETADRMVRDGVTRLVRLAVLPLFVLVVVSVAAAGGGGRGENMKLLASLPTPAVMNTDMAFWGELAFQGSYAGFRVIDISRPARPRVLADVRCGAGQGDVTVWQKILVRSVDYPMTER